MSRSRFISILARAGFAAGMALVVITLAVAFIGSTNVASATPSCPTPAAVKTQVVGQTTRYEVGVSPGPVECSYVLHHWGATLFSTPQGAVVALHHMTWWEFAQSGPTQKEGTVILMSGSSWADDRWHSRPVFGEVYLLAESNRIISSERLRSELSDEGLKIVDNGVGDQNGE